MYHAQSRALQDLFDTRRLADRLVEKLVRTRFTDEDRAFIEKQSMFFLATADAEGYPDCSYKGGAPGFVRVPTHRRLRFRATTGTACSGEDVSRIQGCSASGDPARSKDA
jgi:predicted pyridoxine 5'-phosphate oxidase superfamily flavin-nucleotide-binding protein